MISTQGVSESSGFRPGVYEVKISKVESDTSPNTGTPYIGFTFQRLDDPESEKEFRFFFTDKSAKGSMKSVTHIMTKLIPRATLDGIQAPDYLTYGNMLKPHAEGKTLRMKFTGEEDVSDEGKLVTYPRIGFVPFAEANTAGGESPVITAENSKLKYDPEGNRYDLRKLSAEKRAMLSEDEAGAAETTTVGTAGASSDF